MTIFFPDLSHYNAGVDIRGAAALIAKATQGTDYIDPAFAGFQAQAATLGIPFAAYHWIDNSDPAAQADHAFSVIGNIPTMWDCEAVGASVSHILEITAEYRRRGGNPRLFYLPRWFWQNTLGSPDLQVLAADGLGLVSSSYPAAGYTASGPGWLPYGGVQPVIWQYTDRQPIRAGGMAVDFNADRGTPEQFRALLGLPPQQTGDSSMMVVRVNETGACWFVWHDNETGELRRRTLKTWETEGAIYEQLTGRPLVSVAAADLVNYGVDVATIPPVVPVALEPVTGWPQLTGTFVVNSGMAVSSGSATEAVITHTTAPIEPTASAGS